MEKFADYISYLHELNVLSIFIRLALAVIFGGLIGMERGVKKRQAGFRTHILVCVGATVVMMTNQYLILVLGQNSDPARLGAAVVTGIGFLGAGLIAASTKLKIKGLTTAAGLWACGCVGLSLGVGFYSCAIAAFLLIFVCLAFMQKMENVFYNSSRHLDAYVEVADMDGIRNFIIQINREGIEIEETHLSKSTIMTDDGLGLYISMLLPERERHQAVMKQFRAMDMVIFVEEM